MQRPEVRQTCLNFEEQRTRSSAGHHVSGYLADIGRRKLTSVAAKPATLVDEALRALLVRHRSAEVDASYRTYDDHPVDEPDEWGDLASWRQAAAAS